MAEDIQQKRRFERVAAIFTRARRVAPEERAAYLDVECGDDADLRAEVVAMLDVHSDAPAQPLALVPGVPGFTILRRIGVGGMGTVYEAEQDHPRRRVALKAMRLDALSDESLARFETEARALARLQHPGIARIFQAGRFHGPAGDMPYIVMDLIEGPTITEYAATVGREARVKLLIDVCAAVEHAHQRGILHRDLKPPNILVPEDGRPRVLDFGVAREIESPSTHTRTGHLLGTLAYMSPEQARGEFDDLDTRCDIYAIGVIGYELVSGRVPHDVRAMPLLEAARVVAEQPHRSLGADDLAVVLDKALAKDRDRRYPSASALADDLRRVLRREPVRARPPSRLYHVRRFVQRHRAMVVFVSLVLVALLIALHQAVAAARFARTQQAVAARARYAAQIQAATSHLDLGDVEAARSLLEETAPAQRGWMWDHLWAVTDGDLATWERGDAVAMVRSFDPEQPRLWSAGAAFGPHRRPGFRDPRGGGVPFQAPDGSLIREGDDGRVRVLQADAPARHLFRPHGPVLVDLRFDPERRRALVVHALYGDPACRIVVYDTGTRRPLWEHTAPVIKHALFTADGRRVVACTMWNGEFLEWDAADGTLRRRWTGHSSHVTQMVESRATHRIATFGMDWNIRIWDREGGQLASIADPGHWVHALAFSPDGRWLASGHPRGTVRFWDARTGELGWASAGRSRGAVNAIAWSKDGARIYCQAGDAVYVRLARPGLARDVLAHHRPRGDDNIYPYIYDVAFAPDGRRLASVGWDGTARVCDVATGALIRTLALPPYAEACEFGAGDRLYAIAGGTGEAGVWDAATGRRRAAREILATGLSVHPDGGCVALAAHRLHRVDPDTLADMQAPLETPHGLTACAFAPDGDRIACGAGDGFVLIVAGDRVVRKWKGDDAWVLSIAWSPDGRRVVTGTTEGHVSIYDAATGRRVGGFLIPEARVFSLLHSRDGRLLFVGSDEHVVRVWDTREGHGLGRLRGHGAYVKGLALSPDGNVLASASGDNTVRLWHRKTERARR